nr:uncharacterized protein LOC111508514 isoform X1 [Leptinotarsa decemlineata]
MGCGVATTLLGLACVAVFVDAVLLDSELTKELEEVIKGENFVLSMKHIKPRKRSRGVMETLFAVEFPGAKHKFSLLLDRKVNKVIVETSENNKKRSQYFIVDSLHDESAIKSLILAVNQTQPGAHATLYLDCTSYGMVALPETLRDMFSSMKHPKIEVYHERRYPVEIDGHRDLRMVLSRNECPLPLDTGISSKFDEIFSDDFLSNGLSDDPNILAQQSSVPYRGDIPIPLMPTLDDSGILKALNSLITVVNLEVKRCEATTQALDHLRRLIEQCQACRNPPPTIVATCESHPPGCYPGVRCRNTPAGPICGPCPRGYVGDGYQCTPGRTCAEGACFHGVQCRDTDHGAECGRCPPGYEGNGQECRETCTESTCHPGVQCRVTSRGPECGPCPPGYEGDGRTCRRGCSPDTCYPGVRCRVTSRGPECGPCPAGYEGDGRNCRSVCNPDSCYPGVQCRPTARGPECGPCPSGMEGDGRTCVRRNPCQYPICAPGCAPTWTKPRL